MRVLFLAPLATARITHPLAALAQSALKLGYEVQLLVRQVTRVRTDKGPVLSRNETSVEGLFRQLGKDRVTLLHAHRSQLPGADEEWLDEVDVQRVRGWVDLFCPDLVILSGVELVGDDPALQALKGTPTAPKSLQLREVGRQDWALTDGAGNVVAPVAKDGDALLNALRTRLPKLLDRSKSIQLLSSVLKREQARLTQLVDGPAGKLAPLDMANGSGAKRVLPEVRGELESLRDGDVVFGSALRIKGWIDWSPALAIRELEVLVNDHSHRIVPNGVRGEIAERLKNPDILGFDVQIPLDAEGPPLRVALVLLHKDGGKQVWQRRTAWANDCIPDRHAMPIVLGHAAIDSQPEGPAEATTADWLRGTLRVAEHRLRRLVLLQRGEQLASLNLERAAEAFDQEVPRAQGGDCTFHHALVGGGYDPTLPLDLWVETEDALRIYWQRCEPRREPDVVTPGWTLTDIQDGDVVQGNTVSCTVGPLPDDARPTVFVNGERVDVESVPLARPAHRSLAVPVAQAGNDILIRIECGAAFRTLRVWRHLDVPQASQPCAVVVPHASSVAPPQMAREALQKVLVIRKAPSPTDELYVLAPLSRLEADGAVHITTIDLDADAESPADTDAMLAAGTAVIISRYISDRWISAITRHKPRLGPVFYLMDDDVAAAIDTRHLPGKYLRRMIKVACGEFQTMINLCDHFVVTSQHLLARYSSGKTDLFEPPFLHPPKDLKHLDDDGRITITYQGTEGHKDDLSAIAPALRLAHDTYPQVHLQIIVGNLSFFPSQLKGLPRCEAIPPMPWDKYKEFRAKATAHIALAPILDTPYNRGKSIVKIFDIGALGAVGIYSNSAPYNAVIEHGVNGLLVENDPQMWFKAIKWLIGRPEEIRRLAGAGQKMALDIGDISHLQGYWMRKLELKARHA